MRKEWVDRLKGLLILLVVLGHVVGAGGILAGGQSAHSLLKVHEIIYLFHMPAFFVLAGYIWKDVGASESYWKFLVKKFKRLLIPYFVFYGISATIYHLTCGYDNLMQPVLSMVHAGGWPEGIGFRCNSVLWFLPVMFVTLQLWWVVNKYIANGTKRWPNIVLFAICVASWTLRLVCYRCRVGCLPWGLLIVPWYFPFVVVGYQCAHLQWRDKINAGCVARLCIAILAFAGFYLLRGLTNGTLMSIHGIAMYVAMALIGSWACFELAKMYVWDAKYCVRCSEVVAQLGVASMGIMLLHKFIVVALQEKVSVLRRLFVDNGIESWFGVLIISVAAIYISFALTRVVKKWCPRIGF